MIWQWVGLAFCSGLALTSLCEAAWRWRHTQTRHAMMYLGLAGGLAVMVVFAGGRKWTRLEEPITMDAAPFLPIAASASATVVSTLPPPLIQRMGISGTTKETAVTLPITATPLPPAQLRIPTLHLTETITTIPLHDGAWDVSQLGSGIGWLETTGAHPDDEWAMVFAGHMTFPTLTTLETGAFAELQTLTRGAEVFYESGTQSYRYVVKSVRRVPPDAVDALYLADGKSLLLVTCTDWDGTHRIYANRLVVQAVQVTEGG